MSTRIKMKCEKCKTEYEIATKTLEQRKRKGIPNLCPLCMKIYSIEKAKASKNDPNFKSSRPKPMIKLVCDECHTEYEITKKLFNKRKRKKIPNLCKPCMFKYSNRKSAETKANFSPERKALYSQRLSASNKKFWEEMDSNIRKVREDQLRKQNDDLQASLTLEDKRKISNKRLETIANKSEEEKTLYRKHISEGQQKRWDSADEEYRIEFGKKVSAGMSDKGRELTKQGWNKWWYSLNEEQQTEHMKYPLEGRINWEQNLSDDERKLFIRNLITNAGGHNKFHQKFENCFHESFLNKNYYFNDELVLSNNNNLHCWDYGVYDKKTNELIAVVDLDGSYYHGDSCDYNGLHSHEEYDERRSLSISGNVKIFIIYENKFDESFEYLLNNINKNYNDYLSEKLYEYCHINFPYPEYTNKELNDSFYKLYKLNCEEECYKQFSSNPRHGDRLIYHFHPSIFEIHIGTNSNNYSPIEVWNDKRLLKQCIENKELIHNYLNPNKIVQGFHISSIAPMVNILSPGRCKLIINKYLNNYNEIFDPFCGFGGTMLGALSLDKYFIGNDINKIYIKENYNIIEFLKLQNKVKLYNQDVLKLKDNYECLFTSLPYLNEQCWKSQLSWKLTCDNWIDVCLENFKCKRYLFIVNSTEKYKNNIVDIIKNKYYLKNYDEYIVIIDK